MKLLIQKAVKGLQDQHLMQLLAFIEEEELDFIQEMKYSNAELLEKVEKFFKDKDDATLKTISKDLSAANPKLHPLVFAKKEPAVSSSPRHNSKSGNVLTPNQTLVINKIRKLIDKNQNGKVRTDSIVIKDKSKFFLGGVLTTLVEKKLIVVEVEDKKKYVKLTA